MKNESITENSAVTIRGRYDREELDRHRLQLKELQKLLTSEFPVDKQSLEGLVYSLARVVTLLDNWAYSDLECFRVQVKMQIGEHVKTTSHYVKARHVTAAKMAALKAECNCDNAEFDPDSGVMHDCGGDMDYSIRAVTRIPTKEWQRFKNYGLV